MSRTTIARNSAFAIACLALAAPARAAEAVTEEAQGHFNAGVSSLEDPNGGHDKEAYRELKAAYAASPSWKFLAKLGTSAMKLERDGEAIEAFRKYLSEGGSEMDAEERAQVQRDLSTLESSAAQLRMTLPAGATLLDERLLATGGAVQNDYGPGPELLVAVRPGRHRFSARLADKSDSWEVELAPKDSQQHVFSFKGDSKAPTSKAPTSKAPLATPVPASSGARTLSYVALGVGAVGFGVGTFFGLKAWDRYDEGNALCPVFGACTLTSAQAARRTQLGKEGDSAKTASLIGIAVGSVGVAAGITLYAFSSRGAHESGRVSAYVGPAQLGLEGRF